MRDPGPDGLEAMDSATRSLAAALARMRPVVPATSTGHLWYRAGFEAARRHTRRWRSVALLSSAVAVVTTVAMATVLLPPHEAPTRETAGGVVPHKPATPVYVMNVPAPARPTPAPTSAGEMADYGQITEDQRLRRVLLEDGFDAWPRTVPAGGAAPPERHASRQAGDGDGLP